MTVNYQGDFCGTRKKRLKPGQKYLRGLFSSGTLAAEALILWEEILGMGRPRDGDSERWEVLSNVAVDPRLKLEDATRSEGNCAVDLG